MGTMVSSILRREFEKALEGFRAFKVKSRHNYIRLDPADRQVGVLFEEHFDPQPDREQVDKIIRENFKGGSGSDQVEVGDPEYFRNDIPRMMDFNVQMLETIVFPTNGSYQSLVGVLNRKSIPFKEWTSEKITDRDLVILNSGREQAKNGIRRYDVEKILPHYESAYGFETRLSIQVPKYLIRPDQKGFYEMENTPTKLSAEKMSKEFYKSSWKKPVIKRAIRPEY